MFGYLKGIPIITNSQFTIWNFQILDFKICHFCKSSCQCVDFLVNKLVNPVQYLKSFPIKSMQLVIILQYLLSLLS